MLKTSLATAALAALLLLPSVAAAGWTAKQSSKSKGGGQDRSSSANLTFDNDFLRIDQDKDSSVIVDFNAGKFTFLNHGKKQHASITVEQMLAMRDQAIAQLEAQLPQLPPEIQKQAKERIAQLKAPPSEKGDVKPVATGKKEKINGYDCAIYTWTEANAKGEACLATKVGADVAAFGKATGKLSDKLAKLGAARGGPGSFAMLELGKTGFPVRLKRTMSMDASTTIETVEEISELKDGKIDGALFKVPAGYKETDVQTLMGGAAPM